MIILALVERNVSCTKKEMAEKYQQVGFPADLMVKTMQDLAERLTEEMDEDEIV